jgi:hypothetical protein
MPQTGPRPPAWGKFKSQPSGPRTVWQELLSVLASRRGLRSESVLFVIDRPESFRNWTLTTLPARTRTSTRPCPAGVLPGPGLPTALPFKFDVFEQSCGRVGLDAGAGPISPHQGPALAALASALGWGRLLPCPTALSPSAIWGAACSAAPPALLGRFASPGPSDIRPPYRGQEMPPRRGDHADHGRGRGIRERRGPRSGRAPGAGGPRRSRRHAGVADQKPVPEN